MSLARAVTKRIKRTEAPNESSPPTRSQSVKNPPTNIDRAKISLPVALVSTTNMLSYNAPDIVNTNMRHVSSSTASSSADDSDNSFSGRSRASSHSSGSLTDASSVDSPVSPAPNHLSGYFPKPTGVQAPTVNKLRKSASTTSLKQVKEETAEPVPALPARALSHSKRAHERLAAKRSVHNLNGRNSSTSQRSSGSLRHSREQRASTDMFSGAIHEEPSPHPFGRELEQLNEIVEEFGGVVRDAETEADLSVMRSRNLAAFCAADYLSEIRPLFHSRFGIPQQAAPMAWI